MPVPDIDSDDAAGDDSGLFDTDLRNEIIHGIQVHTQVIETDISDQIRGQRLKASGIVVVLIVVVAVIGTGINAYRIYVENNTFTIRAEDVKITADTRYTFAVSQNGQYLVDAYLIVNDPFEQNDFTYYQVDQIAPDTNDTYYWSIRDDGFYQYLDPADAYPQLFIPLPLRPGMKWETSTYPNDRYSYNKRAVSTQFTAGKEVTLDLPIGPLVCIEITATEHEGADAITLWVAKEALVAKLSVDPDDPTFIAELKNIDSVSQD